MAASAQTLFGREGELVGIRRLLEHSDGPAGLLLEGEPGVGKTALWEAATSLAHESSRIVLACRPTAAEASLSYSALGDLLEPFVHDVLASLPTPQARALSAALLLSESEDLSTEAHIVGVATLGTLRALAVQGPLVLAIDDGQWLDPSSASALAHALRRLRSEPVVVLETLRSPHIDPLGLDAAGSSWSLQRLTLGPLDVDALHAAVRSRLAVRVPRPTMRHVHEISAGKPFFAIELVRALPASDGRVVARDLALPPNLLALVESRIAALDDDQREVLAAAALLASPTVSSLESALPGASEPIARSERLAIVDLDGERVRFAHPLLAGAALESIGAFDRAALHLRLADAVTDSEERARHLALGTLVPDETVAARIEGAAGRCTARGASAAAAELMEHAIRLTPADDPDSASRRKLAAAQHTFAAGDSERSRELFDEVCAELSPGLARARALLASMVTVAHASVGIERCEQAIAEAEGDIVCLADAYRWLGQAWSYSGNVPRALESARRGAILAESSGDTDLRLRCAGVVGRLETITGDVTPGLLEAAVALEGEAPRTSSTHSPTQILGERLLYGDRLSASRELLERCLVSALETGDEPQRGIVLLYLTQLEIRAGNWTRADAHASTLYELDAQLYGLVERTYFVRALVDAHLGLAEETRDLLARDEEESIGVPEATRWEHILNRWVLGFVELSVGNLERSAELLRPLPETLERWGYGNPGARPVLPDTIEALAGVGELAEARRWATTLADQSRKLNNPWALATAARSFALIAAAEGDTSAALDHLAQALEHHERSENPFDRGRTLLVLGETLRRARRKRDARETLAEALDVFDTLGAALWAEKTSAALARIGGRRPSTGGLTPTERRVAELVADGKSNKEIAAALFVTVRTIETHLRHIYGKLDVHSRAELAGRIAREDPRQ